MTVTVDAIPGRVWKGVVEFISFKADSASKTFETRVLTDNPDGAIRAGMLARVSLERRVLKKRRNHSTLRHYQSGRRAVALCG